MKIIDNYYIINKLLFFLILPISNFCQVPNLETPLPIIIIDTNGQNIVDEPKINADMGIIYNGWNETNKSTDPYNNYNGKIGIEIRGNTSQTYPKKSYAVETRTPSGENLNVSLLGMPSENDWVLYGPYSDKTLIRNAIAYKLSRMLGHYAPRTKFCELIINDNYRGLYLLIEKIKRDDNRVNISKLKDTDISGNELTGGYIFKIDSRTGSEIDGWRSPYPRRDGLSGEGLYYQYHYPKKSDIMPEQELYIKNYVTNFENVMNANYKYDETLGYYNYLDMDEAVDYFIVNEACKNFDFGFASFFLYKNKDSNSKMLHFGPVWDFNVSMGNAQGEEFRSPQGWIADLTHNPWGTPLGRPFWFKFIWQDTNFLNLFNYRLRSVRSNYLSKTCINSTINNMVNEISDAVDRNFTRWPILNTTIDHEALGTYDNEIDYLKNWWYDHLNWIDSIVGTLDLFNESSINFYSLKQNKPNPFNSGTNIEYSIYKDGHVNINIYDLYGKSIKTLINRNQLKGNYTVNWDGKNINDQSVSSGIYLYILSAGKSKQTKKMLLLK